MSGTARESIKSWACGLAVALGFVVLAAAHLYGASELTGKHGQLIEAQAASRADGTGLCTIKSGQNGHPAALQLILSTPVAIKVLSACRSGSEALLLALIAMVLAATWAIFDRSTAKQKIEFLANYDPLTGLPNRTQLKLRLGEAIARAESQQHQLGVLFVDLDSFKSINDCLGHSVGDGLLFQLASRLRASAPENDIVGRLSGDEFVIVLNGIHSKDDAAGVADRILEQMSTPFEVEGHRLQVTCSIGISLFPEHGHDIESLIKNADAAMYTSKESGRCTYRFFNQIMGSRAFQRVTIENLLRSALENQEFHLEFQPEVDLNTGKVACVEALLRWQSPKLGLIPPDQFIPIAEESGAIVALGAWVLRYACAEARRWHNEGFDFPVAVNVSALQIRHEGFLDTVAAILKETGLPPHLLEIELTESTLISRDGSALQCLHGLRKLGITLAIDDFGTGYSGLSSLRTLPMDKVKIDRSFIGDLQENPDDMHLIGAVVALASRKDMVVTAEGVESEQQLDLLRELGCGQAQGFYLSKPIPPRLIAQNLAELESRFAFA